MRIGLNKKYTRNQQKKDPSIICGADKYAPTVRTEHVAILI